MSSQYEKRKQKVVAELETKRSEIRTKGDQTEVDPVKKAAAVEQTFEYSGFDIFSPDGGRTYKVAELEYSPSTGEARVKNTFDITRLVALTYTNQKHALNSLKTREKKLKDKDGK